MEMRVEFECIVCGETRTAAIDDEDVPDPDEQLRTLHDCPRCGLETIWLRT